MYTEIEKEITYTHRIYGREKGKKRFAPMCLRTGNFVGNLIYASMINEAQGKIILADLIKDNAETFDFELRKI